MLKNIFFILFFSFTVHANIISSEFKYKGKVIAIYKDKNIVKIRTKKNKKILVHISDIKSPFSKAYKVGDRVLYKTSK